MIKQFLAPTSDQLCQFAEEAQLAYFVQSAQPFDKQAPEQPRQDLHGQEEAWAAGDPAGAVFDTPMFVNECVLYRWAHKVRDKFRGQYSVSGTE